MSFKQLGDFFAEINQQCARDNAGYFLPIWREAKIGKKIEPVGTLTLVLLNGEQYAITATHCFEGCDDFKFLICIGGKAYYIDISKFKVVNNYKNFDISYIKWTDLGLDTENKNFLDISKKSFNDITHCCILGFPISKGKYLKGDLTSQFASYECSIFTEYSSSPEDLCEIKKLNRDYTHHLFFRYEKRACVGQVNTNAIDLKGFSGGGLFGFHANKLLTPGVIVPQLQGILIEKQKHQNAEIGIATKLETIIEAINKNI